jgi:D-Tyr-tRNAtyr deacylase
VEVGAFRVHMQVSLVNDGPVTLVLDSQPSSKESK